MARSMTAYAREHEDGPWGAASWELRSVNHRYLDASFRLPDEWRGLETAIRERLSRSVKRGKIECTLRFRATAGQSGDLALNLELAGKVIDAADAISRLMKSQRDMRESAQIAVSEVLRWPGVIEPELLDTDAVGGQLVVLFERTLEDFVAAREREGDALAALVGGRCDDMARVVGEIKPRIPEIVAAQRERLESRLSELSTSMDPGRVEQEVVLYAQKIDVTEELERLETHIVEVRRVLGQRAPIGRRLDFLMQELNREANTLGSKSVTTETTNASVELKVLIEQMREQIQNLE